MRARRADAEHRPAPTATFTDLSALFAERRVRREREPERPRRTPRQADTDRQRSLQARRRQHRHARRRLQGRAHLRAGLRRRESAGRAGSGSRPSATPSRWLKHATDANVKVQRALAFGSSQSGRFLRTFLYYGFNADEHDRQVFDGVMAHIAGASRLDLNRAWATPTNLGQFDATSFPFADQALRDPASGVEEGALDNPRARDFKPKIFYTNTGVEYWGGGALGRADPHDARRRAGSRAAGQRARVLPDRLAARPGALPARRAAPRRSSARIRTTTGSRCARCSSRWTSGCAAAPRRRRADIRVCRTRRSCARPTSRSRRCPACGRRRRCRSARAPRIRWFRTTGAGHAAAVARSAGRSRRQRARRHPAARRRGAARDLHRLELPERRDRRRGSAVSAARIVYSVPGDRHGACGRARSARGDRRALRVQTGVPRQGARGRRQARRGALLARGGSAGRARTRGEDTGTCSVQ